MLLKIKSFSLIVFMIFLFTSCERELSFENGGIPGGGAFSGTSVFTFDIGSGTSCAGAIVSGSYLTGEALDAEDTVVLQVNVTTAGSYNISTALSNGVIFSGSGIFSSTGLQTITMAGSGTPVAAGNITYTPGNNGCSFSITVLPAVTPPVFTGTFTVKIDGTLTTFNVTQATLVRSTTTDEKRFDLGGVSADSSKRIVITIGDTTSIGNNVNTGDHIVRLFLDDDPATTTIDESIDTDAFYTFSTSLGSGSWLTDVYRINGLINISANSPGTTTGTISGTFAGTLSTFSTPSTLAYTLTEGSFNNITYYVLN
jgi:hypothetical protein